ncbi:regulator of chromosome condensation 1/beta-lactamase-inhibitor protein II [Xylariaceae sp. FL0594]|nr:regulator of chromosome condensation 1/beta-lactamase-inhibitor protein II [Xylariaceae sp. FL0594]
MPGPKTAKPAASGASKRGKKTSPTTPKKLTIKTTKIPSSAKDAPSSGNPTENSGSAIKRKRPAAQDAPNKRKRPAAEDAPEAEAGTPTKASGPAKGQAKQGPGRARKPKPVFENKVPQKVFEVFVFGNGENGELGLGPKKKEALRPVMNRSLDPANATAFHIVDFACGGMHTVALSITNKIVTWGVNDDFALGRRPLDDNPHPDVSSYSDDSSDGDDSSDSDDSSVADLNYWESTPGSIPEDCFEASVRFSQVAAGDSCGFVLTTAGTVYGWGTFRNSQGDSQFGYDPDGGAVKVAKAPTLIRGLPKITQIACGANHLLALDAGGTVWAWGNNEQNQFGRRFRGRHQNTFVPTQVRISRGKVKYIASGDYHSFAVDSRDRVWGWGANNYGQAGDPVTAGGDWAVLDTPVLIRHLSSKKVQIMAGGAHHSAAVTAGGECFTWGRIDGGQLGVAFTDDQTRDVAHIRHDERGKPRMCLRPTAVPGLKAVHVACGTDHTVIIDKAGAAHTSGYGFHGQLGLGKDDDVDVATLIKAKSVKGKKLVRAGAGGNTSIVAAYAPAVWTRIYQNYDVTAGEGTGTGSG